MKPLRWVHLLLMVGVLGLLALSAARTWRETHAVTGLTLAESRTEVRITSVEPGSPAQRAGLLPDDVILEIGGREVASSLFARDLFAEIEPGEHVGLRVLRFGQAGSMRLKTEALVTWHPTRLVASGVALLFCLGGIAVLLRPRGTSADLVYAALCLAGALVLGLSWSSRADALDWLLYWSDRVARLAFPALWIHLVLSVRISSPKLRRWLPAVYAPAVALLVVELHLVGLGGALRSADPVGLLDLVQSRFEIAWVGAGLLAGLALLAATLVTRTGAGERAKARWMLVGSAAGILPYVLLSGIPLVVTGTEPSWAWATLPFLAFVPLTFTGAVLEYRLMDLALFGRRIVELAAMLGLSLVLFLGLFSLARVLVPTVLHPPGLVPGLIAAVLTGLMAPGVRAAARDIVGRLYYRRRYNFRRALERVARELNAEQDLANIAKVLGKRVGEALDASPVRLLLVPRGATRPLDPVTQRPVAARLVGDLRARLEVGKTVALADVPGAPDTMPTLHLGGVQVLVPLLVEGQLIALLAVGARRHGGLLDSDDLDLLRSVANHAAATVAGALHLSRLKEQVTLVQRLQARTETLIQASPIGLALVDQEGLVQHWNPALEALLGVGCARALERSYIDVFPESVATHIRGALYTASRPQRLYRLRVESEEHGEQLLNLSLSPLRAGETGGDALLVTLDDVTEQVRMEEQLIQQDRLASVGMLAAGVAHEVNTPLTGISSFAQILVDETPEGDPRRPLLEKVIRQAQRASQIARGLLSISREGKQDEYSFGPVDLHELAEETIGLLGPQTRRVNAEVKSVAPEEPVVARGDRSRLQQVVMNLMLNALDALPDGGTISVRAWRERDGMARLEIEDDGVGIPEEIRDRIFDPFFTTKDPGAGTGLGLSISYAIVREHAGTLVAESVRGEGTRMRMLLPLATEDVLDRRAG